MGDSAAKDFCGDWFLARSLEISLKGVCH